MGIYKLIAPILSLILLYLSITLFGVLEYPNGLLDKLTLVIWTWLIYRVIVTLLYARYGESLRPYQNRILTPIFILVILLELLNLLPFSGVTNATIGLGDINAHLRRQKSRVPVRAVRILREIPRTENGKVDRIALRQLCSEVASG